MYCETSTRRSLELDPQIGQVALVRQQDTLELGLYQQKFQLHRLAIGIDHPIIPHLPAGFGEQAVGAALLLANDAVGVGLGQVEGLFEYFVRDLAAQGLE